MSEKFDWSEAGFAASAKAYGPVVEKRGGGPAPKLWYDRWHKGPTGGDYYPWIKLEIGDWFFVPYHPTKSSRALGRKTPVITRIRLDLDATKKKVTWIPDFRKRGFTIRRTVYRNQDGVMATRLATRKRKGRM